MSSRALISNGTVVQIEDIAFPVASPLVWVDVVGDVAVGDLYSNGQFSKPAPVAVVPVAPTPLEWFGRLSALTQMNIVQGALASPGLMLFLLSAAGVTTVDLTDARTIAGVQAFVDAGLLTAEEQTTLMTP